MQTEKEVIYSLNCLGTNHRPRIVLERKSVACLVSGQTGEYGRTSGGRQGVLGADSVAEIRLAKISLSTFILTDRIRRTTIPVTTASNDGV